MIVMLLSNACVSTVATDNFCLWADYIKLLDSEIDMLSEESNRQIDRINNEIERQCH